LSALVAKPEARVTPESWEFNPKNPGAAIEALFNGFI
jgi:hypothetical protein